MNQAKITSNNFFIFNDINNYRTQFSHDSSKLPDDTDDHPKIIKRPAKSTDENCTDVLSSLEEGELELDHYVYEII